MRVWKSAQLLAILTFGVALAGPWVIPGSLRGGTFQILIPALAQPAPTDDNGDEPEVAQADEADAGAVPSRVEIQSDLQSDDSSNPGEVIVRKQAEVQGSDTAGARAPGSATDQERPGANSPRFQTRSSSPSREGSPRGRSGARRSRNRRPQWEPGPTTDSAEDRRPEPGPTGSTNAPSKSEYAAYRIISERNIFDSTRTGRSNRPRVETRKPARSESITLVGTLSYEKGSYAFFDGTSPSYKKVLEEGKKIAGYTIRAITPNEIELVSGTNTFNLGVGMQLRRGDEEEWRVSGNPHVAPSSASASDASSPAPTEGAENDVLRRLMQQRAAELK